ncbi:ComEA family DNA-binding protein [Streptomyces sp. DvalAA-43]|uniref:ComEA family DNA-binding protein n=2 Tax=unclassified Streptomyces TaxID=2593676 RepID=UPI000B886614|nr:MULTISPECIES: ComEA family DNA-binding protein [unclassified Streptomyces]MYQ85368.1 ComEA family DNA-binding protein [Streptomyces sp. SID4936]
MAPRSHRATNGSGSGPGRAPASDGRVRSGPGNGPGSGTGPGSGPGLGPGRRRSSRERTNAAAVAARCRADALMTGAYGGRVARPVLGVAPGQGPGPGSISGLAQGPAPVSPPTTTAVLGPGSSSGPSSGSAGAGGAVPASGRASSVAVPVSGQPVRGWERLAPALRERIPVWLQLRCGLEPRTLAALAVVLVAAGVFAAVHFWSGRPHSVRAPDPVNEAAHARTSTSTPSPDGAEAPEPSPGSPPATGPGGHIVVDVSGKVRRPGIRQLPSGARVADALRAAGGVREGADLTGLNRARVLMDGEQIVVGVPPGPSAVGGAGALAPGGGGGSPAGPVSLNTATVEQLETLPGVGPVLAQHIVDYRAQHGGFRSIDELREVNGIGDRRFADLQPLVGP